MQETDSRSAVATSPVVEIRGLVKTFEHGDGVHGLDLCIEPGSAFGFLGPNGAGKSTTIKVLMGLMPPTSGEVNLFGAPVGSDHTELRRRIGYVPEQHFMYPWMTVGEIIWFTRSFYPDWNGDLCERLRNHYGLDVNKKVKELSHGMRTKLALVLALSHNPELLILDEPTTGLDPLIREEFLDGVNKLRAEQDCTVLFSSHIMSDVEAMADNIGIIDGGRMLACASRKALVERTRRIYIPVGQDGRSEGPFSGAVRIFRDGAYDVVTVDTSSAAFRKAKETFSGLSTCRMEGLTLEEIFKDYIKGARVQ